MKIKSKNKISAEFSMASMTDIVFLLLIFFMLTSTLITTNAIEITLPKAGGQTTKKQIISLTVTTEGLYYWDKESIPYSEIETRLQSLPKTEDGNTTILIRGQNTVELQKVTDLLELVRRNGLSPILGVDPPSKN